MTGQLEPGDGSRLAPPSGLGSVSTAQFETTHGGRHWALSADLLGWDERCHLYLDGREVAVGSSSVEFPLGQYAPGVDGVIEARVGWWGMQRAHLVTADGSRQLDPSPGTLEHGRAEFARTQPVLSALVAALSWTVLVVALVVEGMQSLHWITRADWFQALTTWQFTSPIELPLGANIAITLLGTGAAVERALRLRHHWLLDD